MLWRALADPSMHGHSSSMFRKHHDEKENHVDESIRLSDQAARLAERRARKTEELPAEAMNVAIAHMPDCAYYRVGPGACDCQKNGPKASA